MTGVLGQALAYAAGGYPVFPCVPDQGRCPDAPGKCRSCKVPIVQAVPNGCLDATTEPDRIRAWWRRWPSANVGIATGAPGPDVLDIDVKRQGSGWAALGRLKRAGLLTGAAQLVRTPSGGAHIYFAGTSQHCHGLPRHFIDFKAWHGYVLAPPSAIHGGQAYRVQDSRPGTASLDWDAVKRLLDPPRQVPPRTAAWNGGELPPSVQRALADPATDRSRALHKLVGTCVRAGLDDAAIHQIAGSYQPALEKYGPRQLPAEVERSLRKIGAR